MRIFLAGVFQSAHCFYDLNKLLEDAKPSYFLESFMAGENACKDAIQYAGAENFLLDSGAFSYINGKKGTLEEINLLTERYIKCINKYDVKHFFEMDVDCVLGLKKVEELRWLIENGTGKKCIPVWHWQRGIEYWKKMCKEYPYVAIGSFKEKEIVSVSALIRMVSYAKAQGCKVHLLGDTSQKRLTAIKPYSADSCSYAKESFFGRRASKFFNGKLLQKKIPPKKMILKKVFEHNFVEWIKFQKFMEGIN